MELFQMMDTFLEANKGTMTIVLGVLFVIAKRVSNEKAGPITQQLQKACDAIAKVAQLVGVVFKKIADLLADVIKSDGMMGKK